MKKKQVDKEEEREMERTSLENQETNLDKSIEDYQRLILLNKHIDQLFKKRFKEISGKTSDD